MSAQPTRVEKHSPTEMRLDWNSGESFAVPFVDLRFECPCAGCVDEHSGERIIRRENVRPDVRPVDVRTVGRYALQIGWSDGHATGIYHFDTLLAASRKYGRRL